MCGIVGVIGRAESVNKSDFERMLDEIRHRGPDGSGIYFHNSIALGHVRLSIIDVSNRASQPMVSFDENFIITYNGELYNFKEIRKTLESLGYKFRTTSDTEVVLYAYMEWGKECVDRFNGMFAFAILNKKDETVFLARDRYGVKPLYYCENSAGFIFASEVKAIVKHPSYRPDLDKEALLEYFTFQNFFTNRTLYKNIHLMEPGHRMLVNKDKVVYKEKYWDFNFREPEPSEVLSDEEYKEKFCTLFEQAVERQLVSDVPVGAYLSGGMDSGSITAVAATQIPYIPTFTCGFDMSSISGLEIRFDERVKAEQMSYLFKTEHYEMVLKSGDMERSIPTLVNHLEEPRVGQSYPNYYAARLASKFVKVVLSGAGGDELFGGYPWRYYRTVNSESFDEFIDDYYLFWQRLIPNRTIHKVFSPIWSDVKDVWTKDIFRDVFDPSMVKQVNTPEEYLNLSMYLESKTFLHGLLVVEDKLSMASGLESRVPFLDNDLVDFAMNLPARLKLSNLKEVSKINENEDGNKRLKYFMKSNDGKKLMRMAMGKYIPSEVTDREKQGFSAPDASWFKGDSIEYVKDTICNKNAHIYNFLDYKSVNELVDEHLSGKENRRLFIWSLLYFENWINRFL